MDIRTVDEYGCLFYDPQIYGINDDFFQKISGSITVVGGKIRIKYSGASSGILSTTTMVMMGNSALTMTIPAVPTSGDNRVFGYYSRSFGNRNAAYFYISGTSFYTRTYSEDSDSAESNTIPWDASWTNASTKFEIIWRIDKVEFYVGGRRVSTHDTRFPKQVMLPTYFSNGNTDNMSLDRWVVTGARKIYRMSGKYFYSPSPSVSPSISPSISPSVSPSISPSISPSLSPSISPSVSPSVSLSPSISPSISPSLSPSISPSISPSVSPSV